MWPFKRQKNNSRQVPQEVKQYYDSEHRERVGLAWLVAFMSLIVTIAIIAGLFFGGRWTYRKIAHKNTTPDISQGGSDLPAPTSSPSTPSTPSSLQPTASEPTNGGKITITPKPTTTTPQTSSTNTNAPSTAPATGQKITDTGAGNTIAIFLSVTILAAVAHSVYLRRRTLGINS